MRTYSIVDERIGDDNALIDYLQQIAEPRLLLVIAISKARLVY